MYVYEEGFCILRFEYASVNRVGAIEDITEEADVGT